MFLGLALLAFTLVVGLAALWLLRSRARQAGKRLSVVDSCKGDCIAHSATPSDEKHAPLTGVAGQAPLELSPPVGARGLRHACQPPALSDAA